MSAGVRKETKKHLILTETFPLPPKKYRGVLLPKMQADTRIWNSCVWHSRHIKETEGRWPLESELKAKFKHFAAWSKLHSQSAQAVVEEYFQAVRSYNSHRENRHGEANPPGFKPKEIPRTLTWKKSAVRLEDGTLTLSNGQNSESLQISVPPLKRELGEILVVKIEAHLHRKHPNGFSVHITHDLGIPEYRKEGLIAAIDINHAIWALSLSDGTQYLFNLRELAARHQYRAKTLAWFQARLDRCKRGSNRWEKYQEAKRAELARTGAQIQQMEHALTKTIADILFSQEVAEVIVGDLKDLRRSARKGDKNKKANQKINNQMPYARMIGKLDYKLKMRHIRLQEKSERDTSKYCAACGEYAPSSRVHRGLWICRQCGAIAHADLNSSQNLLKLRLAARLDKPNELEFKAPIVYRWDKKAKHFAEVSAGNRRVAVVVGSL